MIREFLYVNIHLKICQEQTYKNRKHTPSVCLKKKSIIHVGVLVHFRETCENSVGCYKIEKCM